MNYTTLLVEEISPEITLVTLNRPERRNAITFRMFEEFALLQREIESDSRQRVVVLTGAGGGFCGGLDLDQAETLPDLPAAVMLRKQQKWADATVGFHRMGAIVIAAVDGPAAGAGMGLALACDVRVASTRARFNAAFVRVGLSGGDVGTSYFLPRIVGSGRAMEILLTGRFVEAEEALAIGLVTSVVQPEDTVPAAIELAEDICRRSPTGMAMTKRVVAANTDATSLTTALDLENRNQVLATRSPDMAEALSAFRDKRLPRWESNPAMDHGEEGRC